MEDPNLDDNDDILVRLIASFPLDHSSELLFKSEPQYGGREGDRRCDQTSG